MISLRDVVTGFGNRDPLAEVWRRSLRGGGGGSTVITGVPPLRYIGDGRPLTDYLISGNAVQDGTPSADAPVDAVGSGVRTGNLLSEKYENRSINGLGAFVIDNNYDLWIGEVVAGQTYAISNMNNVYGFFTEKPLPNTGTTYDGSRGHEASGTAVVTVPSGCTWIAVRVLHSADNAMLNLGSTALPYEPYGFKLPLTVNGTEYPIYLGTVPTTRRVKKLVLTGEESWFWYGTGTEFPSHFITYTIADRRRGIAPICTHYIGSAATNYSGLMDGHISVSTATSSNGRPRTTICDTRFSTTADFKSYLAAQYAAGTPVTVWYVLAEPETAVVNEPLMKIGDYADTVSAAQAGVTIPTVSGENILDVPTEVKPSKITIKGGIRSV